jgi:ADP-ribosyl-[dinitrogen reductase] hydrolase
MAPALLDRYQGALLGLACGDAVGTTVEFSPRGSFPPVTDMVGGGPFSLKPGQWTDDTSMALCLAESLLERGGFDARDQMGRYLNWWRWGYLSSTGSCFDIGVTTRGALARFEADGEPFAGSTDPRQAGNGSLMRLAPVVLYFLPDLESAIARAAESSRTTHGAPEAVDACRLLAYVLARALEGAAKDGLHVGGSGHVTQPAIRALAEGAFLGKSVDAVRGSGYAVASLEASLWCVATTDSFELAVLAAVNLGDDADTTGAIVGQIAGALYGASAIPAGWLERLWMREEIAAMAGRIHGAARERGTS